MNQTTIPTPAKFQMRRATARALPTAFFVAVCGMSALLWQYQNQSTVHIGEVEVIEYVVSSPQAGIVSQLIPSEGQELGVYVSVAQDQLLVQLDDSDTRKRLGTLQKELFAISGDITSELSRLSDTERVALREIAIRLDKKESDDSEHVRASGESLVWEETQSLVEQSLTGVDIAIKQLELRQLDFQLGQAKIELASSGGDPAMLDPAREQRKHAAEQIYELNSSLEADRVNSLAAVEQDALSHASRLLFRTLKNRIQTVETELISANVSAAQLDVVSPVDGQIDSTMVQRAQAVSGGQALLSVIPKRGTTVVVYSREQSLMRPFTGMPVTLRSRLNPNQQVKAAIDAVGPKVESIPQRHRTNPKVVEWGRPMRIRIPADWIVEPGSLLDVIIDQS